MVEKVSENGKSTDHVIRVAQNRVTDGKPQEAEYRCSAPSRRNLTLQ